MYEGRRYDMKNPAKNAIVKCMKEVLLSQVKYNANSTSCLFVCEPKAPETLSKYTKQRKRNVK